MLRVTPSGGDRRDPDAAHTPVATAAEAIAHTQPMTSTISVSTLRHWASAAVDAEPGGVAATARAILCVGMRFFIGVIDSSTGTADADEMAAIDAFNAALRRDGHWVMAAGLAAPGESTVVDARGPEASIRSGPVGAASEYVSGFWIIEARDRDAALALATEGSRACRRRVELRAFL